jgi:hypothetical protein
LLKREEDTKIFPSRGRRIDDVRQLARN